MAAPMTITSSNSILLLGAKGVFSVAQRLDGFAEGDQYSIAAIDTAEFKMGADGFLAAGKVPKPKVMDVTLQANSPSTLFWDTIYTAQEALGDLVEFFGIIQQPSIGRVYTLTKGYLTNYTPIADAKGTLQPRKFQVVWQTVTGAPM